MGKLAPLLLLFYSFFLEKLFGTEVLVDDVRIFIPEFNRTLTQQELEDVLEYQGFELLPQLSGPLQDGQCALFQRPPSDTLDENVVVSDYLMIVCFRLTEDGDEVVVASPIVGSCDQQAFWMDCSATFPTQSLDVVQMEDANGLVSTLTVTSLPPPTVCAGAHHEGGNAGLCASAGIDIASLDYEMSDAYGNSVSVSVGAGFGIGASADVSNGFLSVGLNVKLGIGLHLGFSVRIAPDCSAHPMDFDYTIGCCRQNAHLTTVGEVRLFVIPLPPLHSLTLICIFHSHQVVTVAAWLIVGYRLIPTNLMLRRVSIIGVLRTETSRSSKTHALTTVPFPIASESALLIAAFQPILQQITSKIKSLDTVARTVPSMASIPTVSASVVKTVDYPGTLTISTLKVRSVDTAAALVSRLVVTRTVSVSATRTADCHGTLMIHSCQKRLSVTAAERAYFQVVTPTAYDSATRIGGCHGTMTIPSFVGRLSATAVEPAQTMVAIPTACVTAIGTVAWRGERTTTISRVISRTIAMVPARGAGFSATRAVVVSSAAGTARYLAEQVASYFESKRSVRYSNSKV